MTRGAVPAIPAVHGAPCLPSKAALGALPSRYWFCRTVHVARSVAGR